MTHRALNQHPVHPASRTNMISTPSSSASSATSSPSTRGPGKRNAPMLSLSRLGVGSSLKSAFSDFSQYIDPSGKLNFGGKAVLHRAGVEFHGGHSYQIEMSQLTALEELGKGQYGTVRRVRHEPTGVEMAMKEIRLELDKSKLDGIIMELDVLHKSTSPFIVDFYGAFFVESTVYYCMEYMDAGSLDKLEAADGLPEAVLARTVWCVVKGLMFLKEELSIIHRDVKPTNILVNTKGEVKLCDFGVSGQLEKSLAKTNIGCQPYMAPERITPSTNSTYTVASDVWSLGLSIVEMGLGRYPYANESSVFAQITAIVQNDPPKLPEDKFSAECRDFVARCLDKVPTRRPTYRQLLRHPWLARFENPDGEGAK
ncbi:kinase-like protein [Gonapodya prolifera JEL478]|uniref:mitogen-activated protein kinase kinase n=1 Tax=Gonapodya prolifera (strain JEL478) TaxID=1344416 RepID=A0A139AU82_GONPJ|nr:kinase-like protein [Gonapodya prolifera JEL478]|eukprot:KXS20300.1 kinase-like protein [Gonapodya prolifera JEL478]